jgi:hypothetical protein
MKQVFEELATGFIDYQCRIKTVTSLDELEDGGIMLLHDEAGHYKNNSALYEQINALCPDTVYICWYWRDFTFRPFNKMIRTGENYLHLHEKQNEIEDYGYMTHSEFVPLLLRASDSPDAIGNYPRVNQRDYCFMGGGYKMDWVPPQFTGFYHRVIWDNYLSYNERRAIYLSSMFAFGFQSDENIRTGHLSQRIFEGLAYGCIVLCENKLAEDYTDGAVIYVASKEDLVSKMEYYKAHPDEALKKQQQGYEWTKQFGTNRVSIQLFLDGIQARFNDKFDTSTESTESTESVDPVKPVVSVNIMGGLGNQLFQIAAAYSYARKNNAQLQLLHKKENGNRQLYWDTLLKNLKPFLVESLPLLNQWCEDLPTMYKEIPLTQEGLYLNGYLQSSKYHLKEEVKQSFRLTLPEELHDKYHYLLSNKEHVIIMHSRQTDYVTHSDLHGPLTHTYYVDALEKMAESVAHPFIVLCGDDNEFWKNMDIKYPHIILEENDINTFALLQQFHYFIMSNSTFIWWCAYLANTKKVIVPAKWFGPAGPYPYEDIYEDEWIRM